MRIEPLGDAAYILRDLERPAYEAAAVLNRTPPDGLLEAVASYETVGLFVDPDRFTLESLATLLDKPIGTVASREIEIPVCYAMGLDLEEASERLNIAPTDLVRLHSSETYRCFAIGFCPGFAYLGYLDERVSGLPRRSSPRVRVPPGSVAITGRQTGVYPMERPGGWWLIGRTPLTMVDVEMKYFPIQAGDQVRFVPIDESDFQRRMGERL